MESFRVCTLNVWWIVYVYQYRAATIDSHVLWNVALETTLREQLIQETSG